jgi:hypothetical protein
MNPDAVVALVSSTFKGNSSHEAPMLRSNSSGPPMSLRNGLHPQVNDRTVHILDALAELCVEVPDEDVVAIGMRLRLPNIQLLVATNDVTPKDTTIQHVNELWNLLKQISDRYFAGKAHELVDVGMGGMSPEVYCSTEEEMSLYNDLLRRVFRYGYLKFRRRHDKYWKVFEKFYDAWAALRDESNYEDENEDLLNVLGPFMSHLGTLSAVIDAYHFKNWNVDDHQFNEFFTPLSELMMDEASTILADPTACERWMGKVMGKVNCEF